MTIDVKKLGHMAAAVFLLLGALGLLKWVGGSMFAGVEDGLEHLVHMVVFAFVALFVLGANAYILLYTPMQNIVLPYSDFLLAHEKRWAAFFETQQNKPSQEECTTALAYGVNSGLRIFGFLVAQALIATPL